MTRLIRLPEVQSRTGLGRSAIYERLKVGDFPRPVDVTSHAVAWVADEVDAWVAARIAARDAGERNPVKKTRAATEARKAKRAARQAAEVEP